MLRLEDLKPNASVPGILPDSLVTVVSVKIYGSEAADLVYRTPTGKVEQRLLYCDDVAHLEIVELGRPRQPKHNDQHLRGHGDHQNR